MLNHITIMGRLVRDPELRRTGSGIAVASFCVAVDRDYGKNENGEKEVDFIDCIAWRNTAEFMEKYFSKGRMAVVSGRLQTRTWTDKEGNKRKAFEVITTGVELLSSKKKTEESSNTTQPQNGYPGGYGGAPQGYSQPQYNQQGFSGYQQPSYQGQGYHPQQGSFAPIEDDDAQLPF